MYGTYGQERTGYPLRGDFGIREILEDALRDKQQSVQVYSRCATEAHHPDLHRLFMMAHETEQAQLREIGAHLERLGERIRPPAGAPERDWGRPGVQPQSGLHGPPGFPGQAQFTPGGTGNLPGAGASTYAGRGTQRPGAYGYTPEQVGRAETAPAGGGTEAEGRSAEGQWTPTPEDERND